MGLSTAGFSAAGFLAFGPLGAGGDIAAGEDLTPGAAAHLGGRVLGDGLDLLEDCDVGVGGKGVET